MDALPRLQQAARKPSVWGTGRIDSMEGQKPAARCARCVWIGAAGRCFGRTNRNPFGPSDRSVLIRLVGGTALEKSRGHPIPYEPKSAQPTGSTSLLGGVSTGVPPLLRAVEAVAAGESGVTYRVSWGIETAKRGMAVCCFDGGHVPAGPSVCLPVHRLCAQAQASIRDAWTSGHQRPVHSQ